jgi:hypothetical protein
MKKIFLFLCAIGWITSPMYSQIIVNQADMPSPGDSLRVSITNVVPAGYAKTAMDTAWNYAALEALSQRVDTFVNATATPTGYQLFFVLLGGANLASPKGSSPIPGIPVSQGYSFFKNSSTSFSDLGAAYTIQGLPLPAKYDIPDKLYQFPITPGLTWSSTSNFAITVPGVVSYSTHRIRTNLADGWGNLTTPFGTFQTLRVKSTLAIHDSIYIDSLAAGFPFNRNIIEYKWLAKGKGIPLLQITEEGNLVTATWRDIYRMSAQPLTVSLGPDTAVLKGTVLTLHATVTGGTPPYQIFWNTLDSGNTITVTVQDIQTYTVLVLDALQNFGTAQKIVSIRYPPGVEEHRSDNLQVYPNPTRGNIHFTLSENTGTAEIQIYSSQGKLINSKSVDATAAEVNADLTALNDGIYYVRILTETQTYTTKIQILH